MSNDVKREVIIKCPNKSEQFALGNSIHEQLRGNQDYIDSRIVLFLNEENQIIFTVFSDAAEVPSIVI